MQFIDNKTLASYLKRYSFPLSVVIFLTLSLFFSNCANIVPPTGGPRDTLAPRLKESIPANGSTNVAGSTVTFVFDEYIQTENLRSGVLITPFEGDNYTASARKNKLTVTFNKPLRPNTTYTISFEKAVKDITEGNFSDNIRLSFSTGPAIDSLKLEGKVINASDNKPAEGVLVMLFPPEDTAFLQRSRPLYFAKTAASGEYSIGNLPHAQFRVAALKDENGNFVSDKPSELAGVRRELLNLQENAQGIDIYVFESDKTPLALKGKRQKSKSMSEFLFTKELREAGVADNSGVKVPFVFSDTKDGLYIFNERNADSLALSVRVTDKYGQSLTVRETAIFRRDFKEDTTGLIKEVTGKVIAGETSSWQISLREPLSEETVSGIQLLQGGRNVIASSPYELSNLRDKITVKSSALSADSVSLLIEEGALRSVTGKRNSRFEQSFKPKESRELGTVSGSIVTDRKSYFLQLLNDKDEVVTELKSPASFSFQKLEPGEYKIKVLIDENGNGIWETGSINPIREPEPVYTYPEIIRIKANWDIEKLVLKF